MAHMMNAEVSAMKEINIAKVLVGKRKAKGITQDELASYMGVSKASVSKWETGQSYPDVTFLPMLAAYFNISVDALIDYQPQMTSGDIRKLYRRLAADFTENPLTRCLPNAGKWSGSIMHASRCCCGWGSCW
jgi:transcriptional regulator with XRE-family HTH domain